VARPRNIVAPDPGDATADVEARWGEARCRRPRPRRGRRPGGGHPLEGGKSLWTARVSARTHVRAGDQIELTVDTRNLHFFDPDSGLAVRGKPPAVPALNGTSNSIVAADAP
jgi:hypothetical protein